MAGSDLIIKLPKDSIMLDGRASVDMDGVIETYKWIKVSGPLSAQIIKFDEPKTNVNALTMGVYQFELTVTDNGGLADKDTIQVLVDDPAVNQAPVADAGSDQTINLPATSFALDGSGSVDADNNISGYEWTKISGPSSFFLVNPHSVQTSVTSLVQGVYMFTLKVTDAGGLFSTDTMSLIVNGLNAQPCGGNRPEIAVQLSQIGVHPNPRLGMEIISAGNKIFFAGGIVGSSYINPQSSSRVDIYDIAANTWSVTQLSVPRYDINSIISGNKVIFAGGISGEIGDITQTYHSIVDIYDLATNSWTSTSLRYPSSGLTAAAVSNKVFFAGGRYAFQNGNMTTWGLSSEIQIYDLGLDSWSTANLSEVKGGVSAVTFNNKVFFAGGQSFNGSAFNYSNKIDIYDHSSGTWSTSTLSEAKEGMGGVGYGDKIYWAGGYNGQNLCKIEIIDISSQTTTFESLSAAGSVSSLLHNNKIINFNGSSKIEIFDLNTSSWSVGLLTSNSPSGLRMLKTNNSLYATGGFRGVNGIHLPSGEVYKVEF